MKIAICIPHHQQVHAKFTASLVAMIQHTAQAQIVFNGEPTVPQIEVMMETGSIVAAQRNFLTRRAIDWAANFVLWLDSDQTFPPWTLVRLLLINKPVVGANIPRRGYPTYPTTRDLDGNLVWTTPELAEEGVVERVSSTGLGICLVDMKAVPIAEDWPPFSFTRIDGNSVGGGEDAYFFGRLHEAGIEAYVDHLLSWEIGHIHEVILTNADALAQREAYLAKQPKP